MKQGRAAALGLFALVLAVLLGTAAMAAEKPGTALAKAKKELYRLALQVEALAADYGAGTLPWEDYCAQRLELAEAEDGQRAQIDARMLELAEKLPAGQDEKSLLGRKLRDLRAREAENARARQGLEGQRQAGLLGQADFYRRILALLEARAQLDGEKEALLWQLQNGKGEVSTELQRQLWEKQARQAALEERMGFLGAFVEEGYLARARADSLRAGLEQERDALAQQEKRLKGRSLKREGGVAISEEAYSRYLAVKERLRELDEAEEEVRQALLDGGITAKTRSERLAQIEEERARLQNQLKSFDFDSRDLR